MFRRIRFAVLTAGLLKAFEAIWLGYVRSLASGDSGAYVTTHSDTVLWCTCIFFLVATWFETRRSRDLGRIVLLAPPILVAIVANNRRIAWVSIVAGVLFIMSVAHRGVKRQIARYLSFTWPILVVYVVIGFGSQSTNPIFLPVSKIASVTTKKDVSTDTRDIENFNLLVTLRDHQFLGTGFGHQYDEFVVAYDIQNVFKQYRYLPHNSFLGFWAFNGLLGSALYFVLPVTAVFYATSARRSSRDPLRRAAGAWSVCVTIAYFAQSWADLGMQDWTNMLCAGLAFGMAGSLGRSVAEENAPPRPAPSYEFVDDDDGVELYQLEPAALPAAVS
jgi:O-antigen ligase